MRSRSRTSTTRTRSSKPKVFATRRFPERALQELVRSFDLDLHDSESPPGRTELLGRSAGCAGLMITLTDLIDGELLDAAGPELRVVASYGVGVDGVDLDACTSRGVLVANTPDVLTEAVAELTLAILLALARRVAEGDRLIRRRETWTLAPNTMLGRGLVGLTLGLVGYGSIGRAVARLAEAHSMRVIHSSRTGGMPLRDLLESSDVVSLHVPLTPETHHLVDDGALAAMKPTAVLVNTSRGPIVDEAALVRALAERRIAGAALDVFEWEPAVPEELLALENVVLTPPSARRPWRRARRWGCSASMRCGRSSSKAAFRRTPSTRRRWSAVGDYDR